MKRWGLISFVANPFGGRGDRRQLHRHYNENRKAFVALIIWSSRTEGDPEIDTAFYIKRDTATRKHAMIRVCPANGRRA